jgi:chemotaxis signal transduction protein
MTQLEQLVDTIAWAQNLAGNTDVSKQDVIDGIILRCNAMVCGVMVHSVSTSMSVDGWQLQNCPALER